MNAIQRAGARLKSWWSGDWVNSDLPGNRSIAGRNFDFSPQTPINYHRMVGDIWTNSAVQAVINWLIRAWPESYPCVKEKDPKTGKKVPIQDDHPLIELLEYPNDYQDDTILWAGTILSFWCDGNAYWGINRKRNGDIGEFVYLPHFQVVPKKRGRYEEAGATGGPDFFEYYDYTGQRHEIAPENIVHFRFGVNPQYPLCGLSPWASVYRHVYSDNEAINYVSATLGNRGSAWIMLSPKDVNATVDPQRTKDLFINSTMGANKGSVVVFDGSMEAQFPPTLKDQAADSFHRIPETRICSLGGIPAITVGLAAGLERSTFENTDQAVAAAWNTIVAVQRMMGRQLTQQVLRRPGSFSQYERVNSSRKLYAGFDYSEVRALQEDKTAQYDRAVKAFGAGLITTAEARGEIGYDPLTALQRLDLKPMPTFDNPDDNTSPNKKPVGAKSIGWADRVEAEMQALEEMHGGELAVISGGNGVH